MQIVYYPASSDFQPCSRYDACKSAYTPWQTGHSRMPANQGPLGSIQPSSRQGSNWLTMTWSFSFMAISASTLAVAAV